MEQKIIGAILIFVTLFAPMPNKNAAKTHDQSMTHESLVEQNYIHKADSDATVKKFNP